MNNVKEIRRARLLQLINEQFKGKNKLLAEAIKRPEPNITRALNVGFGEKLAREIEAALGLSPRWLDNPDAPLPDNLSNFEPAPSPRGQIPLISWVKAGEFCEAIDLLQPGDAEDWITTTVQPRAYTYALRIRGDSMEPTFPDGAIIVVEPEMEPKHGSYVIAKNGDNEATFKQLVQDGSDFYLKPLNPRYPLIPVDTSTCFCGVVREMVMRFD